MAAFQLVGVAKEAGNRIRMSFLKMIATFPYVAILLAYWVVAGIILYDGVFNFKIVPARIDFKIHF